MRDLPGLISRTDRLRSPMDTTFPDTLAVVTPWRLNAYNTVAAAVFAVSLFHFTFCLLWALDQPILDL